MASSRIRKQTRLGKLTLPLLSLYRRAMRSSSSLLMEIPARKSGTQREPVSGEVAGSRAVLCLARPEKPVQGAWRPSALFLTQPGSVACLFLLFSVFMVL